MVGDIHSQDATLEISHNPLLRNAIGLHLLSNKSIQHDKNLSALLSSFKSLRTNKQKTNLLSVPNQLQHWHSQDHPAMDIAAFCEEKEPF